MASVSLGQLCTMTKKRVEAVSAINLRFNDRARESLHDDLVALASGNPSQILERNASRQQIMARIDAATTPDELQAILSQGI